MTKFLGKIEELQKLIADLGIEGDWKDADQLYQFSTSERAVLNWFQTTRTVQFQGPTAAKADLEKQATKAISESKPAKRTAKPGISFETPLVRGGDNKRVFVVHGHDRGSRDQLELVLRRLG